MPKLTSGNITLIFDGKNPQWRSDSLPLKETENSDLFRLHLDDGMNKELTVYGKQQTGKITELKDGWDILYKDLLAEDGRRFNIELTVHIRQTDTGFDFTSTVKNNCDVRVNEVQVPFIDLNCICDTNRENDVLLMPLGLGEKTNNPWLAVQEKYNTEYFASDYNEIWYCLSYPFPCSMGWFGVQSTNKFLYLARHDNGMKTSSLVVGTGPKQTKDRLILTVSNYPVVIKGEEITTGVTHLSLVDGWEKASEMYSDYARANWYKPTVKPQWVQECTGFQRIILKHQYGEIYFKYKDLVDIYKQGEKYGLKLMLIFGWWKGRFDNGYPIYEIDPEMGGKEELFKALDEIHRLGGKVALYGQGVLLDVNTPYYEEIGHKISRKDIDGNEYREFYQFSNNGTMLRTFGYKTFASACQATQEWQDKLVEVAKMQLDYKTDMVFFDQVGGHIPKICFDTTHKHKNRVDDESKYRVENLHKIKELCKGENAFGTENTVDVFCSNLDFHHGHMTGTWYSPEAFPQMFKTTFPEEIITNRLLHDTKRDDFELQMNYAFVYGLRYDVSVYRARKEVIGDMPKFGEYLKKILDLKEEYADYFYNGKMVHGHDVELPNGVVAQSYENNKGNLMYALWNNTEKDVTVEIDGKKASLKPQSIACLEM